LLRSHVTWFRARSDRMQSCALLLWAPSPALILA
jgi:hypothetical protein